MKLLMPFLRTFAAMLVGVLGIQAQTELVADGDFELQVLANLYVESTLDHWAETAAPAVVGLLRADGLFQAPLGGHNAAYMQEGGQIIQTLSQALLPGTTYTISFDCYMSSGVPTGKSMSGFIGYGSGAGATSAYAGSIFPGDVVLGAVSWHAPLADTARKFTATFTTAAAISGSSNKLAIILNPMIDAGQIFIDNVSVIASPAVPVALSQLVTNGGFESGGGFSAAAPTSWSAPIGAGNVGQFYPSGPPGYPLAPLSGQVAYMGSPSRIFQTFGQTLQPGTTYYITFQAYMTEGSVLYGDQLAGSVCYGADSGGGSTYAGEINAGDIASGSPGFSAPLVIGPATFTFSFTTKPVITGSANMLAIYLNPGFVGGSQIYLDNVSVIAAKPAVASSVPKLTITRSGNGLTLSWPAQVTGWILESSTDLGLGDTWEPVPGVVDHSVTLDISGVPENFFRLKSVP
jgi:hypothetical protein